MTKELIRSVKMNESCHSVVFSRDSKNLFSIGEGGEVYIWDTRWEARPVSRGLQL